AHEKNRTWDGDGAEVAVGIGVPSREPAGNMKRGIVLDERIADESQFDAGHQGIDVNLFRQEVRWSKRTWASSDKKTGTWASSGKKRRSRLSSRLGQSLS